MSEKFPLVSIITIVYNDKNHIKETMDSVVGQDYERLEYIIIDGNSKDGTRETITEYIQHCAHITLQESNEIQTDKIALDNTQATHTHSTRFYLEAIHKDKPHLSFKFLSERDSGIYDAMNKGIDLATGEWCNFMNCGDRFYDLSVLRNIAPLLDEQYGVIDGGVEIVYDENYKKIKYYNIVFGPFKIEFCHHQASFIQTHLLKKYLYDKEFKIRGEIDFFSKVFINNYKWKKIQTIIATYNTLGISSKITFTQFMEDILVGIKYMKYYFFTHTLYYLFYILPRVCIRNILPKKIANFIRQRLK